MLFNLSYKPSSPPQPEVTGSSKVAEVELLVFRCCQGLRGKRILVAGLTIVNVPRFSSRNKHALQCNSLQGNKLSRDGPDNTNLELLNRSYRPYSPPKSPARRLYLEILARFGPKPHTRVAFRPCATLGHKSLSKHAISAGQPSLSVSGQSTHPSAIMRFYPREIESTFFPETRRLGLWRPLARGGIEIVQT